MVHRLLTLALALATVSCDAPDFEVQAPLFVFNAYPANGALVAREDLQEILIVFSEDLGTAEAVRAEIDRWLILEDEEEGELVLVRPDQTNVAYDPDTYTVRVLVDPPLREGMQAGAHRLTIDGGVTSAAGVRMPQPYEIRFRLAD